MSRFYVGQRVRIKYSLGWPELAGEIGTIIQRTKDAGLQGESEWNVAPDVWGSFVAPRMGLGGTKQFGPNSDQLEPATDSYDVVSWKDCVWQPEHLRVNA